MTIPTQKMCAVTLLHFFFMVGLLDFYGRPPPIFFFNSSANIAAAALPCVPWTLLYSRTAERVNALLYISDIT